MNILQVEKVSKVFKGPFYALNGIDFQVERGEIFGIVGTSGAGKSTLMRCLTRLEIPTTGQIWFENENFSGATEKNLKRMRLKMGKIFQHFNLLSSRTALGNVLFPLEIQGQKNKGRGLELLDLVGLADKAHLYPSQLSGGEKQRVAIARAIAHNPSILFSDEATSALDPQTTRSILSLLLKLNKTMGLTIVLITHQMEVIKEICSRVAVLDKGEIVEIGDVSTLFARPKHPMTKSLLQGLRHDMLTATPGKKLLRLTFTGVQAKEPIISRMIKQFEIEVNILLGGIDVLQTGVVGNLVVELSGSYDEVVRARLFLEKNGVFCEEIS